mgnify:CR=1 FL=1
MEKIESICPTCKSEEIKLRRLMDDGKPTLTYCYVCDNLKCSMKIDISKLLGSWERAKN